MSEHEFEEEGRRVVVRDKRRVDPDGSVRTPDAAPEDGPDDAAAAPGEAPEKTVDDVAAEGFVELRAMQALLDERTADLQRLKAEFDNYRKRMLRDQTTHLERATAGLVEQLLPVLDSFELALGSGGTDVERLRKGVGLGYGELLGALEKAGLERIEALGKPFDPEEHEAVMHVEDDGGDPGVRDVVRSGYRFKGRVIRPAMVKVAT